MVAVRRFDQSFHSFCCLFVSFLPFCSPQYAVCTVSNSHTSPSFLVASAAVLTLREDPSLPGCVKLDFGYR